MAKKKSQDSFDWLFAGPNKLENVKFFRGSRDMISVDEFKKELHSAMMQRKLKTANVSKKAPKSKTPKVNVREFVTDL